MFTTDEFLEFGKSVQVRKWTTLKQKKEYLFEVERRGIRLVLSTGEENNT